MAELVDARDLKSHNPTDFIEDHQQAWVVVPLETHRTKRDLQNILALAAALFLALPAHAADRVRAIDGDTIRIGGETIRIATIDAPETGSRAKCKSERQLGEAAKRRLGALVASGSVQVTRGDPADGRTFDRYGRTLGTVTVNGRDVGAVLVAEGLAREWTGRRRPWCR